MSRGFILTKPFLHDYQELPSHIQAEVDKALALLLENLRHPSLQVKKMQPKQRGIYELRVTQGYRLTFHVDGEQIMLRRVGTHDILRTP